MTLYARSDAQSVHVSGGCGKQHFRPEDELDWALDCKPCEKALLSGRRIPATWSVDPNDIPLTETEKRVAQELAEREERIEAQMRLQASAGRVTNLPQDARDKANKRAEGQRRRREREQAARDEAESE